MRRLLDESPFHLWGGCDNCHWDDDYQGRFACLIFKAATNRLYSTPETIKRVDAQMKELIQRINAKVIDGPEAVQIISGMYTDEEEHLIEKNFHLYGRIIPNLKP